MPEVLLPVRPGGFEAAMAGARRRRRVQLGAGGGMGASVIALVLLLPHGNDLNSLRQVDQPPAAITDTSPSPSESATNEPSATPSPSSTGVPGDPLVVLGPNSSPTPSPEESLEPVEPAREYAVQRDVTTYDGDAAGCAASDTYGTAEGWCAQFPGPFTTKTAISQTYRVQLCRLPGLPAGSLGFTGDQASFAVTRQMRTEWESTLHPKDSSHSQVTVEPGTCARWSVAWDTLDSNGDLLPVADNYQLEATINSTGGLVGEGSGVIWQSNTLSITR